ncbi:MAG: hypothetical protein R2762_16990 [Bryobacteraceae bacterium]
MIRFVSILLLTTAFCPAQMEPQFHLTARPWKPLGITTDAYLHAIEGEARYTAKLQNAAGAIIDPYFKAEHQYATPYFAYAVGTLVDEARAADLLPYGAKAMEHATGCFGRGRSAIPEQHGEFFIAVLTGALPLYEKHVPRDQWLRWRDRMRTPSAQVIRGNKNNWETYVLKGDWMRQQAGLIPRQDTVGFIEAAWKGGQAKRIAAAPYYLYHDLTSDPDTLSVEAVGRGNLLALSALGYDGPSAAEIRRIVETATTNTLWLQDPTGQVPTNGRTDNHVWVEIGYQLCFEVMAEVAWKRGDRERAGQFRHAAMLAFQSAQRWRRTQRGFEGSYSVTKNHFDPALRVGFQPASQYTNYNGSLMFHLSEALHTRQTGIPERPSPSEIGGYAFALDEQFATAFANAGGMMIQANLRGQENMTHANYWSPLGIVRFARPGWDTRLGPSDGAFDGERGVTFAPAFEESGRWLRMADLPSRFQADWDFQFVSPLVVRCSLTYRPKQGHSGPIFRNELTITPSGVLSAVRRVSGEGAWGVTWPVLESDGTPLRPRYEDRLAGTGYSAGGDEEVFLALDEGARIQHGEPLIRSTYGDLRPVLMTVPGEVSRTFVYPRAPGDPAAADVLASWRFTQDGFTSSAGTLRNDVWIGKTAAGGRGDTLDLDGDGQPELRLSAPRNFVVQLSQRRITAVEVDAGVSAVVGGKSVNLAKYVPMEIP